MRHLDLFSGIGGFAYAADQIWDNVEHVFCDFDPFCRQVLTKHWPEAKIYGDIRQITTNPFGQRRLERGTEIDPTERDNAQPRPPERHKTPTNPYSERLQGQDTTPAPGFSRTGERVDLLTGGFPCQPFSAAGLRRGTADERHLWPEMLRVIRLTRPTWVIAENVRGILTWNDGLVFEQVCTDLEAAGYDVQPFIIPAVAVNAPHRRDRVWFVAHSSSKRRQQIPNSAPSNEGTNERWSSKDNNQSPGQSSDLTTNTRCLNGYTRGRQEIQPEIQKSGKSDGQRADWGRSWSEIAAELCSLDDGLPAELGGLKLTKAQHRKEQLKAYGNAIVPEVALQIMRGISL